MVAQQEQSSVQETCGGVFPPVSMLMYLFADRFVPVSGSHRDIILPCNQARVALNPLADRLMASAFWSLREQGLIALHLVPERILLFRILRPVASLTAPVVAEPHGAIERAIVAHLRQLGTATVETLIRAIFGGERVLPHLHVLNAAVRDALGYGYAHRLSGQPPQEVSHGALFDFFIKPLIAIDEHILVGHDCARLATLRDSLEDVVARWNRFRTGEAALFNALVDTCSEVIADQAPRYRGQL